MGSEPADIRIRRCYKRLKGANWDGEGPRWLFQTTRFAVVNRPYAD